MNLIHEARRGFGKGFWLNGFARDTGPPYCDESQISFFDTANTVVDHFVGQSAEFVGVGLGVESSPA